MASCVVDEVVLVVVPRLLSVPHELDACVCPNLDGSGLGGSDSLFHAMHQVLGVAHQHLSGFLVFLRT